MLLFLGISAPVSAGVKIFSEESESVETSDSDRGEARDRSAAEHLRGPKSHVVSLSLSL